MSRSVLELRGSRAGMEFVYYERRVCKYGFTTRIIASPAHFPFTVHVKISLR